MALWNRWGQTAHLFNNCHECGIRCSYAATLLLKFTHKPGELKHAKTGELAKQACQSETKSICVENPQFHQGAILLAALLANPLLLARYVLEMCKISHKMLQAKPNKHPP